MDLKTFLAVFLGGGIGSGLRFFLAVQLNNPQGWPVGTMISNALACLVLAFFSFNKQTDLGPIFKVFCLVGFTGGLSTFSTWIFETHRFFSQGNIGFALFNIVFSVLIGLAIVRLMFWGGSIA